MSEIKEPFFWADDGLEVSQPANRRVSCRLHEGFPQPAGKVDLVELVNWAYHQGFMSGVEVGALSASANCIQEHVLAKPPFSETEGQ